jgi:hypothetical protein
MLSSLGTALLFFALAVLVPGLVVQRWARLPVDPALVVPLGTTLTAAAHALDLVSGTAWVVPLYIGASCALLVADRLGARASRPWTWVPGPTWAGALPAAAAIVGLLALTQYGFNRLDGQTGDFLLDPFLAFDATFHVGVTRELTLGWPPQVPGLAGVPLGYHLGLDLLRAAALRHAGTDPFDALSRLDVTWNALALVLMLRAVGACLGLGRGALALLACTPLLTDGSWLWAGHPQAHWWSDLLRGNLLISLAAANSAVPALTLALGCLLCLERASAQPPGRARRGALALAALQAAAVPHFKVFLGAHLLLGLVAWALLRRHTWRTPALAAVPCALSTAMLVLGRGGESVAVTLAPLDLVQATRASLGELPLHGGSLLAYATFWLLASLGLRLAGVPAALCALRAGSGLATALAAMALSGWPLGLMLRVAAPEVLAGERVINDAAYLVEQSGPLLWIFTVLALARWATRPLGRVAAAVGLALSLPASLHFAWKKADLPADAIPAARVRAAQRVAALTAPGEVVLQRPGGRWPALPVVLVSRRVAFERFTPYLTQFAARPELLARQQQVATFFRTRDGAEAARIAAQLGARVVVLYDGERVRFAVDAVLEPVQIEERARVYKLRGATLR